MPETTLVHRVLGRSGYVLAAVLVLGAGAVLAQPLLEDEPTATGAAPGAPAEGDSAAPAPSDYFPDLGGGATADPGKGSGGGSGQGTQKGADGPCGTQRAFYKRADDGVKVTVVFTGVGAVRALVVPANGEPSMQSYTTAGDPTPHIFDFPDVSSQAVKKVGLTVTTREGARDCELQRR
ncbi:hypothetical protein EDD29_1879 [Actinocorallia herbida]|uniref:Uncharacterized protein n=1 Tax=Actinocorallia herbida TaxID=58109 RepID=A0A3N1CSS0_9ACTN|nr:hypothetical protein [Actinocorallia herbida]ROO84357.1 hypothetical protein EDD29_1879 [Actinocorallia herbida]